MTHDAVKHCKLIKTEIQQLRENSYRKQSVLDEYCEKEKVSMELLKQTLELERLPVVTFAAGGIATPADAALMMHLGVDGIFVGSGIFDSSIPDNMAKAICLATTYYQDYSRLVDICNVAGTPMVGSGEGELNTKYEYR